MEKGSSFDLEKNRAVAIKDLSELKEELALFLPSTDRAKKEMAKLIALIDKAIEAIKVADHSEETRANFDRILAEFDNIAMEIDGELDSEMRGNILNT